MPRTLSPSYKSARWFTVVDGARVRQLRHQQGLSTAELADKAGIGLSTVTRLERENQCRCRTRTLARLAAALGERPVAMSPAESVSADVPVTSWRPDLPDPQPEPGDQQADREPIPADCR